MILQVIAVDHQTPGNRSGRFGFHCQKLGLMDDFFNLRIAELVNITR